ncbi:MAG: DnaJ domain-containing protein [Bacteroidota bacterium]|nr:DnaJ domain-containing protein [Bacteroidota bacterium]
MVNPYIILGVATTATQAEIKKAFRTQAKRFHPDLNKDSSAAERIKEIYAAYDILSDVQKRQLYDEYAITDSPKPTGYTPRNSRDHKDPYFRRKWDKEFTRHPNNGNNKERPSFGKKKSYLEYLILGFLIFLYIGRLFRQPSASRETRNNPEWVNLVNNIDYKYTLLLLTGIGLTIIIYIIFPIFSRKNREED